MKNNHVMEVLRFDGKFKVRVISMNEGLITTIKKTFSSIKKAIKHYNRFANNGFQIDLNDLQVLSYDVEKKEFERGFTNEKDTIWN